MAFNVLIVDDSSSMRAVIKKTIKVSGFKVGKFMEAADGREALRVLAAEWVDLVLSDINMPGMDGLELVRAMKNDDMLKTIPVVMVTTEGSEEKMNLAREMGARGYIKKPFMPRDIKESLSHIMGEEKEDAELDADGDEAGDF